MKKIIRTALCAGLLAVLMCVPAFAAQNDAPAKQGDFYLLVNGSYVTFTDAVPKLRDGRSFLPFVATFEQLGFEDIKWDGATRTVTAASGDTAISMTIGQKEIKVTQGGESKTISADVAPYVDPSTDRTYVPFGLAADALGYKVGWDAAAGAVIIDDVDAILAANAETYTLMDQYMDYNRQFSQKPYQVTGNLAADMKMTVPGEDSADAAVKGKYEMLMDGMKAFQFETAMNITATGEEPIDMDLDMRGNMSSGVFYLQSAALAETLGQPGMASTWYKLDLAGLMDQMGQELGMSYASLMEMSNAALEMDFAEYLESALKAIPVSSVDATTADVLAILNNILGDSAFKKSGSNYVSTLGQDGAKMTLTLYTDSGKVNGYAVELNAQDLIEVSASMRGNKLDAKMGMDMEGVMTFTMTMDGTYKVTTAKPAAEPPAGAAVIDLSNMLDQAA